MPSRPNKFKSSKSLFNSFAKRVDVARYGKGWAKRSLLYRQQNPVCYCDRVKVWNGSQVVVFSLAPAGTIAPSEHTDHIRPLSAGGAESPENYQALCQTCHSKKTLRWG